MAAIGTRSLTASIGGTEYKAELAVAKITSAESESDFVTFADAAAGGARDYFFEGTAAQDAASGSLWRKMWDSPGSTIACVYRPYGNATASVTQPHWTFNVVLAEPDGDLLGGEADKSVSAKMAFEFKWALTARPVMVTS